MLKLEIQCDDVDQARIYLNAQQYHNLLCDLHQELRNAMKTGENSNILRVFDNFYTDICQALDHHTGPY